MPLPIDDIIVQPRQSATIPSRMKSLINFIMAPKTKQTTCRNQSSSNYTQCNPSAITSQRLGCLTLILALCRGTDGFPILHQPLLAAGVIQGKSVQDMPSNDSSLLQHVSSKLMPKQETQLQYFRDSSEITPQNTTPLWTKWRNILFPPTSPGMKTNSQEVVDEYLEFLDRRYRRLHETDTKAEKNFSALEWLRQGSSNCKKRIAEELDRDNALYVLGVASLASEKLLQKHQLFPRNRKSQEVDSKTNGFYFDKGIQLATERNKLWYHRVYSVLQSFLVHFVVGLSKVMLFSKPSRHLKALISTMTSGVRMFVNTRLVKNSHDVLDFGSGEKNLARTLAVAFSVCLFLHPGFQFLLTEK